MIAQHIDFPLWPRHEGTHVLEIAVTGDDSDVVDHYDGRSAVYYWGASLRHYGSQWLCEDGPEATISSVNEGTLPRR